jgi:1,2-diacylglycerol-3-alpha-glucose alpha-1,2-galactosyltransferase
MNKIRVNMVSESDVSVQGHGVHTAYIELAEALEKRDDIELIRSSFGQVVNCDIIHLHTIGPRTWRKLFQKGPKKVISAHIVPASFVGSIVLAKYWQFAARWYMQWFYNRADKVLAVSETVAHVLRDQLNVPEEKIQTFYNSIDMKRYSTTENERQQARMMLNLDASAFIVVGDGQVQPRKRLDIFVTMALSLPDVTFIWVGGIPFKNLGADYAAMQRLMESAPKNLLITGIVDHEKIRDYLAAANVFCLPAEQENHPMCVLEAAGAGLPIILRDIPEYNDTFGHDAWRCNDDEFVGAVARLRDDKGKYQTYQQGAAAIAERYDSSVAADRLVKLYLQMV